MGIHVSDLRDFAAFARERGWKRRGPLRHPPHYEALRLQRDGELIVFYQPTRSGRAHSITPRGDTAHGLEREFHHKVRGWCDRRCDECRGKEWDRQRAIESERQAALESRGWSGVEGGGDDGR